ncbi:MAG TPA: sigma-54 dependent transcriptional regulator, partial [Sandaracinaceae bacterium]
DKSILIVDDDPGVVEWLVEELTERGYRAEGTTDPREALSHVRARAFGVVVSDVEMPGMRGLDLVRAIHRERADQLVVLITAFGTIELAMKCVRAGAADFLAKPFTLEALLATVERTLRERRMRHEVVRLRNPEEPELAGELVAESPAMQRVVALARRVAKTGSTILLTGESGVGKSAVARFVHDASDRASGPFVQLNCAALPASLAEAELFGVRRGAFTDAREDRPGIFARAHGGTLLLDEIGEMAVEVQPKLLLALETGTFRPVGGGDEIRSDVRLIAATNRPLEDALRERRLRSDLYHRLNVIRIEIPPLRERIADIPGLVDQWLHRLSARTGRNVLGVSDEAMRWICAQPWPGNVRELGNAIERALMLSDHDVLVLEDFTNGSIPARDDDAFLERAAAQGIDLAELERRYIRLVLARCEGNKAKAARILGIDRSTLWRKLGSEA